MPFYKTGMVQKLPITDKDVAIVLKPLLKLRPDIVFAAGDLSDPHGTHRVCLSAIFRALDATKDHAWRKDCEVWLYRGAWHEWGPEKIEMAVPLSPHELLRKRAAIFKHQSQKDRAMFPGADPREFWQRAEDRNKTSAETYDVLGLPEYHAIEAFVKWPITRPAALLSQFVREGKA